MKIITWNINGIRAALKKGLLEKMAQIGADIYCFQEIKCQEDVMLEFQIALEIEGYDLIWHYAISRKGYSGTATAYRKSLLQSGVEIVGLVRGLGNEVFDVEGRTTGLKMLLNGQKLLLLNCYYPQGGRGPERIAYKIEFYRQVSVLAQKSQTEGFQVILTGDFNTTFGDIDLARPKENKNTTGCLPIEREALNWFVELGLNDAFRHFVPEENGHYTYWDQITRARERNVGWRIDMFLVSTEMLEQTAALQISKCVILNDIMGSDHCPVLLELSAVG